MSAGDRKLLVRSCLAVAMIFFVAPKLEAVTEWPTATPESEGFNIGKLDRFRSTLRGNNTRALLIARHGKLVFEWYAPGYGKERPLGTASLAKALVGGDALMIALDEGRLHIDDLASKYIPAWKNDPLKKTITIRQLATHSSGLDDAEAPGYTHENLPGWKGAFWKRKPDPISIAIHDTPVVFEPGTRMGYSNPGMAALGYAITASLRGTETPDILTALRQRLCEPLGISDDEWRIGYGERYKVDGLNVYATWGGAKFTPRATAHIGQMMLQRGRWNGKQLFPEQLVREMTAYAGTALPNRGKEAFSMASGLGWWTNYDGILKAVPKDAFAGAGAGQEVLLVVPSLDLVLVRYGQYLGPQGEDRFWQDMETFLFEPVMEALRSGTGEAAYAPSPVIDNVRFAPKQAIVRRAVDSDNWPLTWGDDNAIYTSYGDGFGFKPFVDRKLSMGTAKVTGMPPQFSAVNLRSSSIERTGDGRKGPKASGILMVNGVLYLWVRNTGNAQLAWSGDHGKTWTWGFKFEESFGSPAFLNFGKNYAGARDRYVYVYSQDGPSAYHADDRIVLARVPKNQIRDRDAYRYFVRLRSDGNPVWSKSLSERGGAFSFPGHCQRTDAVYDPAIKRYLLAVAYSHGGGWGLYDAPEPWGPWTTVFHTLDWDLGGTHGYRFTTKWLSPDGLSGWMVFSGVKLRDITYDAFCVRHFTFHLRKAESHS